MDQNYRAMTQRDAFFWRKFLEISLLASKITPYHIWNFVGLLLGYSLSKWTKRPFQWGLPISISIEPTTSCNLRCPECPSGLRSFSRPTGMLDPNLFQKVLSELHPQLAYLTFYFQGEPFLNPRFLEMVAIAHRAGIYTSTSTNAHYFTDDVARQTIESGLDRLIISIDGTSQETYMQYRVGGRLEKVLGGTKKIVEWKRKLKSATPHIIFQFLVVAPNEHQIPDVFQLAAELGVDEVKLKTAQIYDFENGSPLIPSQDKYSRYLKGKDGRWQIKNPLLNQCWQMWSSCVITWDGKVVPCCFDKDASHTLGSMQDENFRSLWRGNAYKKFRQSILRSRKEIDICTNCTEGLSVWAET